MVKFTHAGKEYEMQCRRIHFDEAGKHLTNEEWEKIDIRYVQKRLSSKHRSEAQKARWRKVKEAKILGIQYIPKNKKVKTVEPQPYKMGGLLKKYYMNKNSET